MNNLVHDDNPHNQQVTIGDGMLVSMKTIQSIYNEITGKSESKSKAFTINHKVNYEDICQLHTKINQLLEQYNVVGNSCNITTYHVDDSKQIFSSFERFKLYDSSSLSPTENIRLTYHFLILLPKVNKPQSYKIEIDIHSRLAIQEKSKKENDPIVEEFFVVFSKRTAALEIEYVDYTVARNFEIAIDHWFSGLDSNKPGKILIFSKKIKKIFPFMLSMLSAFVYIFVCSNIFIEQLAKAGGSTSSLYMSLIITFFGCLILVRSTDILGRNIRQLIDKWECASYLNLNRGDHQLIESSSKEKTLLFIFGSLNILLAFLINIAASWTATILKISS